jgi:hypothetical protein
MKYGFRSLALVTAALALALTAGAQTATPPSSTTPPPPGPTSGTGTGGSGKGSPDTSLTQRRSNQQQRVANGMGSGEMTPWESHRVETEEAAQSREANAMKQANGGTLSAADKSKLQNQDNKMSNQIHNYNHNSHTLQTGNTEIGNREQQQQQRIAQGVRSGQITAGEASKMESQQQAVQRQIHSDKAANGGKLTQSEKQQVNQMQNRGSKEIYNKKHNDRNAK